ncbi:MAG: bacterio-opsin activator domain-containing protein [Halobacterium sp.]
MSVVADVSIPPHSVALAETLAAAPETVVEVERVVAHPDGTLTPYFWVHGDADAFEAATADDPTVESVTRLDERDGSALYRASWPADVETIAHATVETGGTIVSATGRRGGWDLTLRFDDPEQLPELAAYCSERGVEYDVERVYRLSDAEHGAAFGVTEKQREALLAAHERGFYEVPREATMAAVADALGVSQQAVSNRLRRGHGNLVESLLTAGEPPAGGTTVDQ